MGMEVQDPPCQVPGCQQGGDAGCCKKEHRTLKALVVTIAIVEIVLAIFYLYHFGAKLNREINGRVVLEAIKVASDGSRTPIVYRNYFGEKSPAVFKRGFDIEGYNGWDTLTTRGAFAWIIGLEVFRLFFGILLILGAVLDNFIICAVWIMLTVLRIAIEFLFEAESEDFKVLYFQVTILYIFFGLAVFCFAESAKKMSAEKRQFFGKQQIPNFLQPIQSESQPPGQSLEKPSMSAPAAKPSMTQPA